MSGEKCLQLNNLLCERTTIVLHGEIVCECGLFCLQFFISNSDDFGMRRLSSRADHKYVPLMSFSFVNAQL